MLALMSAEELQRMASMVSPGIQQQYAAGRALTRLVLSRRLSMPARRVPLATDGNGRPYLHGGHGPTAGRPARHRVLDFNLSHSGGYVALAVCSGMRVGLDIELQQSRPTAPALARRFFSPDECALLDRSDERSYSRRWHRIWTTREAHAKAGGIGVRALAALPADRGHSWQSCNLDIADGYIGTVVALPPEGLGSPGSNRTAETKAGRAEPDSRPDGISERQLARNGAHHG
jgi:4'-phosphopantetheinyl transferase